MPQDVTIPKPLTSGATDVPNAPQGGTADDLPPGFSRPTVSGDLPPGFSRPSKISGPATLGPNDARRSQPAPQAPNLGSTAKMPGAPAQQPVKAPDSDAINSSLTSAYSSLSQMPSALAGMIKHSWMDKPQQDVPTAGEQILSGMNPANAVANNRPGDPRSGVDWGATGLNTIQQLAGAHALAPEVEGMVRAAGEAPAGIVDRAVKAGVPGAQRLQARISPPTGDVTANTYSPPGSRIGASLRSNARVDVPAIASEAHPAIQEGLADRGFTTKDFQGKNGPQVLQSGIDNALDINEARAKSAIDPGRGDAVEPEMAARNPDLMKRFSPEQIKKGLTYGDIDAERIQINKELRRMNFYSKDPSLQYAQDQSLANAGDQARDLTYNHAQQVTGIDLRPLKATESHLIKLGDLAETTKNTLSAKAAQHEATPMLNKIITSAKNVVTAKANPLSSFFSYENQGIKSPLNDFNRNMQNAFPDLQPKIAPRSMNLPKYNLNLTPPPGGPAVQPLQGQLPLVPGEHGFQLTPPAGQTPPAPASQYGIPGFGRGGADMNVPPQPELPGPLQPATTAPAAPEVPGPLKSALSEGGERRLAPRGNLSPEQIIEGIKQRGQGPQTVVQDTEGAADLIKRSGVNNRGESMVYSDAGGEPRVTTLGGLNGSAKIGELVGKDIGNGTIEVTSNQIYGKNLQGVGRGTDQINHFLRNMGPETKIVKSDISTSVGARGAWEHVMEANPKAVTKQVFKDGQVQYTVDMSKFARNR